MQIAHHEFSGRWHELLMPDPSTRLERMGGQSWGRVETIFTPAYWRFEHWVEFEINRTPNWSFRLGDSLMEEVIACSLGGHGLPAEVSLAYFQAIKKTGWIEEASCLRKDDVLNLMKRPPDTIGAMRRFRFWKTKGSLMFRILTEYRGLIESAAQCPDPIELRCILTEIPGIGLKTASWISRNWTSSSEIAVIDIHILRALSLLGYGFPDTMTKPIYLRAERAFLDLALSIDTNPCTLDLVMWSRVREMWPMITKYSKKQIDKNALIGIPA